MSNSIFYTQRFVSAVSIGSNNANINSNQTVCCSNIDNICSKEGPLTDFFYIQMKNKYDFVLAAIEIYDILLNNKKMIDFIHFVLGLSLEWELVAEFLSNKLLTSACLEGLPWRNGSILDGQPIPNFAALTSTYADLLIGFFNYLIRDKFTSVFNFSIIQEAYEQQRSECVLNQKYWDSDNYNPRKPFTYSKCGPGPKAGRTETEVINKPYKLSLIPSMVWLSLPIDILIFLDPKTKKTSEYIKIMRRGRLVMKNRYEIRDNCIRINQKIKEIVSAKILKEFTESDFFLKLIKTKKISSLIQNVDKVSNNKILLELLLKELPVALSDPTKTYYDKPRSLLQIYQDLDKIIFTDILTPKLNEVILKKSIQLINIVINDIKSNNITSDMLKNVCTFYNKFSGLKKLGELIQELNEVSNLKC